NFQRNLKLVDEVRSIASEKGCTPSQLALAWVLAQGNDLVPIPGTKRIRYLEENVGATNIFLTERYIDRIDKALPQGAAAGTRYSEAGMKAVSR
ncbi:MAG TPA: aldo/keto reductase, partial [Bryobacteraceae bacterium]